MSEKLSEKVARLDERSLQIQRKVDGIDLKLERICKVIDRAHWFLVGVPAMTAAGVMKIFSLLGGGNGAST